MRIISFFYYLNWPISILPKALLEAASPFDGLIYIEAKAEWRETGSAGFFSKFPLGCVAAISIGKFFLKNLLGLPIGLALVVFPLGTTSGGRTLSDF